MEHFQYNVLCCHVWISVAVLRAMETIAIIVTYLTGVRHPLMTCQTYNVTLLERYNEPPMFSEHRICTTNGPLLFWIIIHVFTDILALVAVYTKSTKVLFPYLFATAMDLLMSLAYVVVLLVFVAVGEEVNKILVMSMIGLVLFKAYDMVCGRRLYWYLQWQRDSLLTPRSAVIKDDQGFQF
ncbi:unnamed protein product [Caenorhabditis auriculariae]|uniref:Uncharacterized protein n=1 Tax=Caenorhabditis auriculariae TaxID=2777116 RepID=A0A8S1GVG3_9PELO|nr:unnamed protein product [Caenorhabditis auriculariae]